MKYSIKLLKLYARKITIEPIIFSAAYQPDEIPEGGIWQTIGVSEMDIEDPLFTLTCVSQWGGGKVGQNIRVRLGIMVHCFDRVELTRTPIETFEQQLSKAQDHFPDATKMVEGRQP